MAIKYDFLKKEDEQRKKRYFGFAAVLIIVILAVTLVPQGQNATATAEIIKLKTQLASSQIDLDTCSSVKGDVLTKANACAGDLSGCQSNLQILNASKLASDQECLKDKTKLASDVASLEKLSTDLNSTLSNTTAVVEALKQQYADLAQNAANNMCCKAKVDNPKLKFFNVDNTSRISCSEDKGTEIKC